MAWTTAREMRTVSRADSLALVLLLADERDARFPRAAGRWGEHWIADHGGVAADEQLVLAALDALGGNLAPAAIEALREACDIYGEDEAVEVLVAWRPMSEEIGPT